MIVDFIAVAMALDNTVGAVHRARDAAGLEQALLSAEAHGAAEIGSGIAVLDAAVALLPFGNQRDHRMRGVGLEFGAVRAVETDDVARELDDSKLHAEADTEIRQAILARIADRFDLPFDAPLAKTARHQD